MNTITVYIAPSKIHGNGIFTRAKIWRNDQIFIVSGLLPRTITPYGKMVNHQLNGNCILEKTDNGYILVAIKDIKPGEELTSNYLLTPPIFKKNVEGYTEL